MAIGGEGGARSGSGRLWGVNREAGTGEKRVDAVQQSEGSLSPYAASHYPACRAGAATGESQKEGAVPMVGMVVTISPSLSL